MAALRDGATSVRAVEVNRGMIELMKGPLAAFSGNVYTDPRVDVEFAEARNYLARTKAHFDALQISLIDSWAATAAGAHALSEGYLYTVEAMRTYLRKLNPAGVLSVSRWDGIEASRLLGTVSAAAAAEGWSSVSDHVLAEKAGAIVTVLASPTAFGAAEHERARALAEQRGWDIIHPVPGSPASACVRRVPRRVVCAPSGDRRPPIFFNRRTRVCVAAWKPGRHPLRNDSRRGLLGTSLAILVVGLSSPFVFEHTRWLGPGARGLVAGTLTTIMATQLGAWFPAGLLRFGDEQKAWFWLVNGAAGVVGGMLALGVAIDFGFHVLFIAAAAIYLTAAALVVTRRSAVT